MGVEQACLENGVKIVGLKFHAWTMARGQYYTIKPQNGGYGCMTTWYDVPVPEMDGSDANEYDQKPFGRKSCVWIGEEMAQQFFEKLIAMGILGWDGYSVSKRPAMGTLDGDRGFECKLLLSDGKVLTAQGDHARPDGYAEIVKVILDFFKEHEDYSEYFPKKFPFRDVVSLTITVGNVDFRAATKTFKVQLTSGWKQWAVMLKDPSGEYLSEKMQASASGNTEKVLPFGRFMSILQKYDMERFNQVSEGLENVDGLEAFSASIRFDGDMEYSVSMNLDKKEYAAFLQEMIGEMKHFYDEMEN